MGRFVSKGVKASSIQGEIFCREKQINLVGARKEGILPGGGVKKFWGEQKGGL